ncbi:hypothetical protein [Symbioplanes lichenis]|uniref:hypothetical protein n=1 Tax=Symbioplanes lichenis TaxID=1629072 RepID=UPI002738E468|nr:hypothetical protein [Actinoplanes lichenis]
MTDGLAESTWRGLVAGARESADVIDLRMALQPSHQGLAGSFLGLGSDLRRWWVKPAGQNEDMDYALVTEFVVGRAGSLIGAPTCENAIISIGSEWAGWDFAPGRTLVAGLGHGTVEVEAAIEERPLLRHRDEDDNQLRHAGVFALHDWCWGSDQQWLHSTTNQNSIYSHDHGFFFPPSGWRWEAEELRRRVDEPHVLRQPADGLLAKDLQAIADQLDNVNRMSLARILRQVPRSWPVLDSELETLGWFMERRAGAVAGRLRDLI